VFRAHIGLSALLAIGAGGLATVLVWGLRMRGGECSQYTPPGWLLGAVLAGGLLVMLVAFIGSLYVDDTPELQRVYAMVGVLEMAAAVGLVLYLVTKSANAFSCG
jgi:hypothetical protein